MKNSKDLPELHKIELRAKNESYITTGANTELLLDGMLLKGVTKATIEIEAGSVATLTIKMVGNISNPLSGEVIKEELSGETTSD